MLLPHLERGERIDATLLRHAMEHAFGASDASGAWDWKAAYEACEVATVLFLRKYGKALFRKADSPTTRLSVLSRIVGLLPTHTRRSEESQALQQFSTPLPLGLAALTAAAVLRTKWVASPGVGSQGRAFSARCEVLIHLSENSSLAIALQTNQRNDSAIKLRLFNTVILSLSPDCIQCVSHFGLIQTFI